MKLRVEHYLDRAMLMSEAGISATNSPGEKRCENDEIGSGSEVTQVICRVSHPIVDSV